MAEKAQQVEKKEGEASKTADVAGKVEERRKLPQLGALEDDDEFEVSPIPIWIRFSLFCHLSSSSPVFPTVAQIRGYSLVNVYPCFRNLIPLRFDE